MLWVDTIADLREQVGRWRNEGQRIALVPTMGNLHEGHLALVKKARDEADRIIVSVFVNPTQFVAGEDYDEYPRTPGQDREKLAACRTDLVFQPGVDEIYPGGFAGRTSVTVPALDSIFCGAFRPGHFTGVATVVCKLLNIVQPDCAIFGEKDYQQLLVVRHLAADLCLPIRIIGVPTVREKDGLALSSRNGYLSAGEREVAPRLYQVLCTAAEKIKRGDRDFDVIEKNADEALRNAGFRTEYLAVRNAGDFGIPGDDDLVILAAAWLGKARLIDNIIIRR